MEYSLFDFLHVLATGAADMFIDYRLNEKGWLVDARNGMISQHDIKRDYPLKPQLPEFYEKMKHRTKITSDYIRVSGSVGIAMCRNVTIEELQNFAEALHQLFPHSQFHILNVRNRDVDEEIVEPEIVRTGYSLQQIHFRDIHEKGTLADGNILSWRGCETKWEKTLTSKFTISHNMSLYSLKKKYIILQLKKIFSFGNRRKKYKDELYALRSVLRNMQDKINQTSSSSA